MRLEMRIKNDMREQNIETYEHMPVADDLNPTVRVLA